MYKVPRPLFPMPVKVELSIVTVVSQEQPTFKKSPPAKELICDPVVPLSCNDISKGRSYDIHIDGVVSLRAGRIHEGVCAGHCPDLTVHECNVGRVHQIPQIAYIAIPVENSHERSWTTHLISVSEKVRSVDPPYPKRNIAVPEFVLE
jgi:hypothetical protein